MTGAVSLSTKLATFEERWAPRTVARYNDNNVMVVKVEGTFTWHAHDDTDDFFMVLSGELIIDLEAGPVTLGPGEIYVVPKGVRHRPRAARETHLLLMEPAGTPNTGDPSTAAAEVSI